MASLSFSHTSKVNAKIIQHAQSAWSSIPEGPQDDNDFVQTRPVLSSLCFEEGNSSDLHDVSRLVCTETGGKGVYLSHLAPQDAEVVQPLRPPALSQVSFCFDERDGEHCLSPLVYTEPGAEPICLTPLISSEISKSIDGPTNAIVADFLVEEQFEEQIEIVNSDREDVLHNLLHNFNLFPIATSKLTTSSKKRKREGDEDQCLEADSTIQRRFTKWHKEPLLSRMRAALIEVRFDRQSSTDVAHRTGIPARTIRRYVKISKDPLRRESQFYMQTDPRSTCHRTRAPNVTCN